MRNIHIKQLKKFTIEDIKQMREMCRQGIPTEILAKTFNCHVTTITHWVGDLLEYQKQYVQDII